MVHCANQRLMSTHCSRTDPAGSGGETVKSHSEQPMPRGADPLHPSRPEMVKSFVLFFKQAMSNNSCPSVPTQL